MSRKIIALTVMIAFFIVFSASAFPLRAQETPGAIEKTGKAGTQGGGGSILPIVLIGVGVLAIAAVLIFVVFKTTYDVTGSWVLIFNGYTAMPYQTDFVGTKESGTWSWPHTNPSVNKGTYTVSDKTLTMVVTSGIYTAQISGTFTDKDTLSGTWSQDGSTFNWSATRGTAATKIDPSQAQQAKIGIR
jgi:hypothetical protein